MPAGIQQPTELLTKGYAGTNNALQFSQLNRQQSPSMQNAWAPKIGSIGKRPGTVPVTTSALAAAIAYLTAYKISPSTSSGDKIYAASGTTLYQFDGMNTLVAQTMTAALATADIHSIGFTNASVVSRLLISDAAALKQYDGTAVTLVTPAVDDASPAPANGLASINLSGNKFIWNHTGHVFVSPGNDTIYYSKNFIFDYFPVTYYFQLERDNDFVNGDGVSYDSICLIPMRRGWAILSGANFSDFAANSFLNTQYGVIAPRSIAQITYPDGTQTIPYLSDNGVHEIFIVSTIGGSRQYATRSLMQDKIDFVGLGLTDAEKAAAVGVFHPEMFLYLLSFKKSGVDYTYAYDTRNKEWYTDWLTFNAASYVSLNGVLYFAGSTGNLHKFDENLYSDWNESTKTTGTAVHFKRYTSLLFLEQSGYPSYWDYYIIEQKQYQISASLDVYGIFTNSTTEAPVQFDASSAVWDETEWDVAVWSNEDYTDTVNAPNRFVYKKKSKYTQMLWENNRDEPVEVYFDRWIGRLSGQ